MNFILGIVLIAAGGFLVTRNGMLLSYLCKREFLTGGLTSAEMQQNIVISGALLVLGGFLFCLL